MGAYNPVYVQSAATGATWTTTLGTTPTVGNFLIAFGYDGFGMPTLQSGWTLIGSINASAQCNVGAFSMLAYRQVQPGDTTTQTPFAGTTHCWPQAFGTLMVEVSGLDPNWVGSFGSASFAIPDGSGPPVTSLSTSSTSGFVGNLAFAFSGWFGSATTFAVNLDGAWTVRAQFDQSGIGGIGANSQTFGTMAPSSPNSPVSVTASLAGGQSFYGMATALLILGTPAAAGWVGVIE